MARLTKQQERLLGYLADGWEVRQIPCVGFKLSRGEEPAKRLSPATFGSLYARGYLKMVRRRGDVSDYGLTDLGWAAVKRSP